MGKSPHVAIVGAGLAGLRCADLLGRHGVKVTVFEARGRVGGRVAQSMAGDHLVDLGPNWIHGSHDNPISHIAHITRTHQTDFDENQLVISRDGKPLDDGLAGKVSDFVWTTIGEAFEYSNTFKDRIPIDRSLFDFFRERLDEGKWGFNQAEKEVCLEYARLWGSYVGEVVEKQSLRFFWLEECIDSSNSFVSSTYTRILDYISKAALEHAEIRYNQPVVHVEAQPGKNRDTNSDNQQQVILSTKDGHRHAFDEVVITCPLGWLKRNKEAFTPALPARLTRAIDNISYGRLEKIYVTFPRAFWDDDTSTSAGSENRNPTFAIFLDPIYYTPPLKTTPTTTTTTAAAATATKWNQECISLTTLPAAQAHPTLLFYTHGPCATHIVAALAALNQPPSSAQYHETLDNLLHPFYSRLPGYNATSAECQPRAFLATTWQADEYAGNGSYSNFQVGLEDGARDIEVLRSGGADPEGEGIGVQRGVWFAGEHTAPFVALGTTTGAYWSGERAARSVCRVLEGGARQC